MVEAPPLLCEQDPLQDQVAEEPANSMQRNRARAGPISPSMQRATSRGSLPGMRGRERPNHSPAYDPFVPQGPHVRYLCFDHQSSDLRKGHWQSLNFCLL